MKITVTGSLGNISKPLTQALVAAGHTVTVISSDAKKAAVIETLGAIPAIGSIEDVAFLTKAFTGADIVYTMVPPHFGAPDWKQFIIGIGHNYAAAIKNAGVKNIVNLSSIGAHLPEGVGPVSGIHFVELALNDLANVNVLHLRPGYFYTNLYNSVGMIKNMDIIGGANTAETRIPMVHPEDIAKAATAAILGVAFKGKTVQYVVSDVRSSGEVAQLLGAAIGKPNLPWVEFTDEQNKAGMIGAGLPENIAQNYTEMGAAMRSGKMFEDFKGEPKGRKLEEFAREFAASF